MDAKNLDNTFAALGKALYAVVEQMDAQRVQSAGSPRVTEQPLLNNPPRPPSPTPAGAPREHTDVVTPGPSAGEPYRPIQPRPWEPVTVPGSPPWKKDTASPPSAPRQQPKTRPDVNALPADIDLSENVPDVWKPTPSSPVREIDDTQAPIMPARPVFPSLTDFAQTTQPEETTALAAPQPRQSPRPSPVSPVAFPDDPFGTKEQIDDQRDRLYDDHGTEERLTNSMQRMVDRMESMYRDMETLFQRMADRADDHSARLRAIDAQAETTQSVE